MRIDEKRLNALAKLQKNIGIFFDNAEILNRAFIHPSYAHEQATSPQENNQRLEFLGDAVLELVVTHYLYDKYPELTEGQMTKIRALVVCEPSLARVANELSLGEFLILGKGEENTGGREKSSILADTFEALIGAIYIEKNLDVTSEFIIRNLEPIISKAVEGEWAMDYKTTLQEILQKTAPDRIAYEVEREEGPAHDRVFYVKVVWRNRVLGRGSGRSKKEAEQEAAREALRVLSIGY
jgi:ribonuclease-3